MNFLISLKFCSLFAHYSRYLSTKLKQITTWHLYKCRLHHSEQIFPANLVKVKVKRKVRIKIKTGMQINLKPSRASSVAHRLL